MAKTCILTDSTTQFPIPAFEGRGLVHVIPLHVQVGEQFYEKSEEIRANNLPTSTRGGQPARAIAPSVEEFERVYTYLGQRYDEIVVILHAAQLSKTFENGQQAAKNMQGHIKIFMIDGQTTGTGLGLIVQTAAAAAELGQSGAEIENLIRSFLPRIYTVFCIEGLSYLHHSGYLSAAQALIGEYNKMLPLYILDETQFAPSQKARNLRHLVDLLHEFICEFTEIDHIAFIQGVPPFENETRALRERITLDFETIPISEHTINAPLAAILGPRTLGLYVLQSE